MEWEDERNGGMSRRKYNRRVWSREEDEKLLKYVRIHGENRWKQLPADTGLNRNDRSCRARWKNYLNPRVKRGNFSDEEDDLILRLHNLIGNRWSLIARRLPSRTDNEIKNHWYKTLTQKYLTIDELNIKLNQSYHRSNKLYTTTTTVSPSSNIALNSKKNGDGILCFYDSPMSLDITTYNTVIALANEEFDGDRFFELLDSITVCNDVLKPTSQSSLEDPSNSNPSNTNFETRAAEKCMLCR